MDAEHNRQVLNNLVCERLAKDRDMERRLEQVEQHLRLQSTASFMDNASIRSDATTGSDNLTIRPPGPTSSISGPVSTASRDAVVCNDLPLREFEALLNTSRVYRRNENREENMSFRSSVIRLSAWSALSDMSLANISIIAVMSLPVQLQELSNGHWYENTTHTLQHAIGTVDRLGRIPSPPQESWARELAVSLAEAGKEDDLPDQQPEALVHTTVGVHEHEPAAVMPVLDDVNVDDELCQARHVPDSDDGLSDEDDILYTCKGCGLVRSPRSLVGCVLLKELQILEEGKAFELGKWSRTWNILSRTDEFSVGHRWHIECFRCNTCNCLLDSDANLLVKPTVTTPESSSH